jgi:hypothetical protein
MIRQHHQISPTDSTGSDQRHRRRWIPFRSPLPDSPAARGHARRIRVIVYCLLALALIAPIVQLQFGIHSRLERQASGEIVGSKTALLRWAPHIRRFWDGGNIYQDVSKEGGVLHPNMPFVVILLSPFAYLPTATATLAFSILRAIAVLASLLMLANIASHQRMRIADWVIGLGFLWAFSTILADFQHGNTNTFVMFFIVLHLWAYRRGSDLGAGAALAVAICLKMTPALFVLYWLYQRNWRLVLGTIGAGLLFALVVPLVALGPSQAYEYTSTWVDNLILPGLIKGVPFPAHVNQSLSGMASRLFLDGSGGDAFYNPDDYSVYGEHPVSIHVTLWSLPAETVKWIIRVGQVLIVAFIAWAIGWRKLPRNDGRRALHYGLITLGMMLLNQRTWHHHATVILIATVAIWQAIAYGMMRRTLRACCLWAVIGVSAITWLTASDIYSGYAEITGDQGAFGKFTLGRKTFRFGELWADLSDAYGPQFWCFVILLIAAGLLSRALRRGDSPYANRRQKLNP